MEPRLEDVVADLQDLRARVEVIEGFLVPELSKPGPPPLEEQLEASRARIRARRESLKGGR